MADAVLQEVDSGWLRRMSVKPRASFFGGNREVCPDGEGKDAVMLRAVSLILIKCLERKLQHVSTAEASHAVNVQQYTRELLVFLQQQQVFQDQTDTHSCSWISLVFGEQDDDLMESIKALTALYLYQKRLGSSDPEACNWGCNPHCHFILLLQSLFFDHTVLLDFLISAETCFLEYCVLYLKHLPETWQEFCNACSRIEDSERKFGGCDAEAPPLPAVPETSVNLQRTSFTPHPKTDPQSITSQRPGRDHPVVCSLPRLVDYESSEGSEEDEQNGLNLQMKGIPKELVANSGMRRVKRTPRSADSAEKMRANSSVSLVRKVVLCLAEVGGMIETIGEWFWWDRLWLPFNLTWADLEDKDGCVYAKASDLYITLPCSIGFLIIRYLFERLVATPFAASLGVVEKNKHRVEYNPVLENYYVSQSKSPGKVDIQGLSKKCSWSNRHVERWFRRKRNLERPGVLKKFREASWRFVFYLGAFIGGILALYDKPWFYNLREVWVAYPKQSKLESQYWYYILELSFYWSLLFSITFDVKRKDFKEQVIHHLATLTLLAFSWCANYIRVGTLVMLVHDSSDVFLESAKVFNYAKWGKTCNSLFVLFAVVFMVTRLIIFPFWIIHCTWVYPTDHYPEFFGYYFFNAVLCILLMLHIFWAYLIVCMLKKFLFGSLTKDERSDNEEEEDDEDINISEGHSGYVKVTNGCGRRSGVNHH